MILNRQLLSEIEADARRLEGEAPQRAPKLERRIDGQLWATTGERESPVRVHRCFPWSEPQRYVSLRDDEQHELAFVADAGDLDSASRIALEEALAEAGFILEILAIREIHEEVEIRRWVVQTRQGQRSFQTRLDDWPRAVPGGGMVVIGYLIGPGAKMWRANPEQFTNRIECTGLYWHFVDLVWIFLFPSLYLL